MDLNRSPENQSLLAIRRNRLIKRATKAELFVKSLLDGMGEKFIFQKGFYTDKRFFIVDFYMKRRRQLCLEIDGEIHEQQSDYDARRDAYLTQVRGFRVLRITNKQALAMTPITLDKLIS